MTSIINYILWGADPDRLDSVTGLSRRDEYLIRRSWSRLYAQPIDNGMMLFVRLFRKEPSTQDYFATIKGLPEEQFTNMPQFKAHVLGFMNSINMAITTLQQPEVVKALMRKLGRAHRRANVKPDHFHIITQVLVDALKSLHEKDDVVAAWGRLLGFLYKPLFEVLTAEE